MTAEALAVRILALEEEKTRLLATINVIGGRLQECREWLAMMQAEGKPKGDG